MPPELERVLYANRLEICRDTLAQGDCGVHGFGLSLHATGLTNKKLAGTRAYKSFLRVVGSVDGMVSHLRAAVKSWMYREGDSDAWDGMCFKALALAMSSHQESYAAHVERMARAGEWVDASVIHALGVLFSVDVQVWQVTSEPTIVGHSLANRSNEPHAIINMAMISDLHVWGVRNARQPLLSNPERGDWMQPRWQALPLEVF